MKVKISSDLPEYDLSNPVIMDKFNNKLNSEINWSYSCADKVLDIQASEEILNILIDEFKNIIEI